MVDHAAVVAVLNDFSVAVASEFEVEDLTRQLAHAAVRLLEVDGAGVMLPKGDDLLRFVFATDDVVATAEQLQETLQEGPCRDARQAREVINLADLAKEDSWPIYRHAALDAGLHAVTAVPLVARGEVLGVLDVYRRRPERLDAMEITALQALSNLATSFLVMAADRDAARSAQALLAHHAMHDQLTGLPVRWVFLEQLEHAVARLARDPGQLAVLFLDLDGLKYVNDNHGHAAGDKLITTSVRRVRRVLRPTDVMARIGGDEFVVLLEGVGGRTDALAIARRMLDELAAPFRPNGEFMQPSASIGLALTQDAHAGADMLIARADSAMYEAKQAGRGRCEVFDEHRDGHRNAHVVNRDQFTADLRVALRDGQIEAHYQPIIDLTDWTHDGQPGTMYAVEALARWRHPLRGLLTATEFLPDVERAGMLGELDNWMLHEACRQLAVWDHLAGPHAPQRLFLNVSPVELVLSNLPRRAAAALTTHQVAPDRLVFEVTESGLFTHPHAAEDTVRALQAMGCDLAIDDFGSGFSSLSRLEQIPAGVIKIDGSFARDLHTSAVAKAVISSVLLLGQRLDRTIIVEGVEEPHTLDVLRGLGVTHVQGYHLMKPQQADVLELRTAQLVDAR